MTGAGMSGAGFAGGEAARRSAASLLGSLTGDAVVLRIATPPVGDSDAEELGLGSPEFQDVALTPALVRVSSTNKTTVLIAASAVEAALGVDGAEAVELALKSACFVQVSDDMLQVAQVERRAVFGRAYLYRLLLKTPETR